MNLSHVQVRDWDTPSPAARSTMSSSMFEVGGSDVSSTLDLSGLVNGDACFKPAGPASDWRSCAATELLTCSSSVGFAGLENAWLSCLLQSLTPVIFQHMATDLIFWSLGSKGHYGALAWTLTRVEVQGKVVYTPSNGTTFWAFVDAPLTPSDHSAGYMAAPAKPVWVGTEIALQKTGKPEPLLKAVLRAGHVKSPPTSQPCFLKPRLSYSHCPPAAF